MKYTVRFVAIPTLALLFSLSLTSQAQQWSKQEQELINHLKWSWDVWMEAVENNDPEIWIKRTHAENHIFWWTLNGAPHGSDYLRRNWDTFRAGDPKWIDVRPVAIRIYGNVGIIQFYGYWKENTKDGPVTIENMRTEVFIKRDGHWGLVAGHASPVSSKD